MTPRPTPYMGTGAAVESGTVTAFDPQAGTGSVTADDGTVLAFHCIEIADGTRTIPTGTAVTFQRLARFGTYQAAALRPA